MNRLCNAFHIGSSSAGELPGRLLGCMLILALAAASLADEKRPDAKPKAAVQEMELRGKVVCLPEEMHRLHQAALPTKHEHLYGFKAEDGKYYTLLRTKYSEALFVDEQVRQKELALKGRLFPDTRIFEPTTLRSVRSGKVFDLVYYCGICEIYAVAPGICECCQAQTELIEKPVEKK